MKINKEWIINLDEVDGKTKETMITMKVEALKDVQETIKELKLKETEIKESLIMDDVEKFRLVENNETKLTLSVSNVVTEKVNVDWKEVLDDIIIKFQLQEDLIQPIILNHTTKKEIKQVRYTWGKK